MVRWRKTRVRLIVALAIVALGSVAFGSLSGPSASGVTTSVTIAPKFVGVVNATAPCQAGRTVVVKRFKRRAPDKEIGRTMSDASGDWAVPSNREFGKYYAVAKSTVITGTGTGYGYGSVSCDRGKSPTLNLGRRPR